MAGGRRFVSVEPAALKDATPASDQMLKSWFLSQGLGTGIDHPVSYRWVLRPIGNQNPNA